MAVWRGRPRPRALQGDEKMSDPRFPIGKFSFDGPPDEGQRQKFIDHIEQTPAALRASVQGLSPEQIETPYRDGGWTVRQVVHHVPESHMNSYIRCKLALTENEPTIKPYMEDRWADTAEVHSTPLDVSLVFWGAGPCETVNSVPMWERFTGPSSSVGYNSTARPARSRDLLHDSLLFPVFVLG